MSDQSPSVNPKKAFVKEKHEKIDTVKKEIKTLYKDLNKLRANNADGPTKKDAFKVISEKRSEYKELRKTHFTAPV